MVNGLGGYMFIVKRLRFENMNMTQRKSVVQDTLDCISCPRVNPRLVGFRAYSAAANDDMNMLL